MTNEEMMELGYKEYPESIVIDESGFPFDENESERQAFLKGLRYAATK
jgi:hypothetical protein